MDKEKNETTKDNKEEINNLSEKKKDSDDAEKNYMVLGMCVGMCLGTVFGEAIFGNMSLGTSLGMCFGLAIGSLIKKKE